MKYFGLIVFLALPVVANESALSAFKGAFSEPVVENPKKVLDIVPFFKRDLESTQRLMALIKEHFPSAKEEQYSSSSTIKLSLDKSHSLEAQFSNDSLYQLKLWGKRGKEKINKLASLVCAVSEYPQCVEVVTNMYKSLNNGTGLNKLRCGDLKITVRGLKEGYEFITTEPDYRDKRYSEECW